MEGINNFLEQKKDFGPLEQEILSKGSEVETSLQEIGVEKVAVESGLGWKLSRMQFVKDLIALRQEQRNSVN